MNYSSVEVYKDVEHLRGLFDGLVRLMDVENEFTSDDNLLKRIKICGMVVRYDSPVIVTTADKMYNVLVIEDGLEELHLLVDFKEEYKFGTYIKTEIFPYRNKERKVVNEFYKVMGDIEVVGKYKHKVKEVKENVLGEVDKVEECVVGELDLS